MMSKKRTRKKGKKRRIKAEESYLAPLPTTPEVLRGLALALDTKGADRKVGKAMDEYVSKGQYLRDRHSTLVNDGVILPIRCLQVECLDKPIEILNTETSEFIESVIERFFSLYHGLILRFDCEERGRKTVATQFVPVIALAGLDIGAEIEKRFDLPSLAKQLAEESVVEATISHLEGSCPGWADAVARFREKNVEEADYISRWKAGVGLPSLDSLKKLVVELPEAAQEQAYIQLLMARAIAFLCRRNEGLHKNLRHLTTASLESFDPSALGVEKHECSQLYHYFLHLVGEANGIIENDHMLLGGKHDSMRLLVEAKAVHKSGGFPQSSCWPLHLVQARHAIANCRNRDALLEYKKVFSFSLYSAGEQQIDIIEESLKVAAICKDVRFLERLKNQAIAFDLVQPDIEDLHDPEIAGGGKGRKSRFVQDWEIDRWRQDFHQTFPPESMFIDADGDPEDPESPFIIVDPSKHQEPDLKKPDKIVQYASEGGRLRKPQILYYASKNDFRSVKKLIKKGADYVTPWRENGESVFHFAIRWMSETDVAVPSDESLYRLVLPRIEDLADPSNSECLTAIMTKTPFVKKQYTVLGSAVETCRPDVVEKVLELGAAVDQGHTMDKITPLYLLCQIMDSRANLEKREWAMQQSLNNMSHSMQSDIKRRYGIPVDGSVSSPSAANMIRAGIRLQHEKLQRINRDNLLAIARILLENKADPNAPHTVSKVHNRTPLMMAVESGDLDLLDLLVDYGGDISLTCHSDIDHRDYSCIQIAEKFGGESVLDRLKEMQPDLVQ